jgi:hypothetical protein
MKNFLSLILLLTTATLAFAQGKLQFFNDATRLIYFTSNTAELSPADASKTVAGFPLAGSGAYTGAGSTITALAGSPSFIVALYGGTSASSLSLQTTTTIGDIAVEGQVVPVNVTFASLPAGTPAWFQIQVYDSRASSAPDAKVLYLYEGESAIFTAVPQASAFFPIYQTSAPVSSTWAAGTFTPVDFVGFPGYKGAIAIGAFDTPEPGTFAVVGFGAATLLIFRRRWPPTKDNNQDCL